MNKAREILKEAAIMRKDKKYNPEELCRHGHSSKRYTKSDACVECCNLRSKKTTVHDRKKSLLKKEQERRELQALYGDREIITREEAIERDLSYFFTGKLCKREHTSDRNLDGHCLDCVAEDRKVPSTIAKRKKYRNKNRDRINARRNTWGQQPHIKQKRNSESRAKRALDPEGARKEGNAYYLKNKKHIRGVTKKRNDLRRPEINAAQRDWRKKRIAKDPEYLAECKRKGKIYLEKNSEKLKTKRKAYYRNNAEQIKAERRAYRAANPELIKEQKDKYLEKNRDKINARVRHWVKTFAGKLSQCFHSASWRLKNGSTGLGAKWKEVDYTVEEWIDHLSDQCPVGITLEEIFDSEDWHIDHILPVNFFKEVFLPTEENFKLALRMGMDLENLQILSAFENMSKGKRLDWNPELQNNVFDYLCEKHL